VVPGDILILETGGRGPDLREVSGEGYAPEGEIKAEGGDTAKDLPDDLKRLLEIGLHCNNVALKEKEGQWVVEGNPSEGALIVAAMKAGLEKTSDKAERLSEIPFSSDTKYMGTLHRAENGAVPIGRFQEAGANWSDPKSREVSRWQECGE